MRVLLMTGNKNMQGKVAYRTMIFPPHLWKRAENFKGGGGQTLERTDMMVS
jgi:hypothetical protein